MTLVKICGITNLQDARGAVKLGADMLGFNFCRLSPRFISPDAARRIIDHLPSAVQTVGVFVNELSPSDVIRIADRAGVTAIQLHGEESPPYCAALSDRFVIKAFRVGKEFDPLMVKKYAVKACMLDGFDSHLRGGTGKVFDWTIARHVKVSKLFLAGGLSPDNVRRAIDLVSPYAVDACSGLESFPGKKDLALVELFVRRVRSHTPDLTTPT